MCKLASGEECRNPKFMHPFAHTKNLILDYSEMAEKGLHDMIEIDELNHATVLYNLFTRYSREDIYTYVGPTLLAINPFKPLNHKYPPGIIEDYKTIVNADEDNINDVMRSLQPHVYAISAYAHWSMTSSKTRQAIVISGESGAGKTESARQCMAFLTSLGSKNIGP